jgi:hypothetical protein
MPGPSGPALCWNFGSAATAQPDSDAAKALSQPYAYYLTACALSIPPKIGKSFTILHLRCHPADTPQRRFFDCVTAARCVLFHIRERCTVTNSELKYQLHASTWRERMIVKAA